MFHNARLKLTLWYVLIIALILVLFNVVAYQGLDMELRRSVRNRMIRDLQNPNPQSLFFKTPQDRLQEYEEIKGRLVAEMFFVNLIILFFVGGASYFLAGKTLKPVEEMLEEQKRFVADASHELRTPLTSMKTEIEVELRNKQMNLTSAKQLLKSNLEEIDKMQKLTTYLLSLGKYQNNQINKTMKKLDLKLLINASIAKVSHIAKTKQIQIVSEVQKAKLCGDEVMVSELFTIILDNAIKYSFDKGKIEVRAFEKDKKTIIEFEDHGEGINEADLPHIFDRFYRAEASRSKDFVDGFGLGLSIAKQIVDIHRGSITVRSTSGRGTLVQLSFSLVH